MKGGGRNRCVAAIPRVVIAGRIHFHISDFVSRLKGLEASDQFLCASAAKLLKLEPSTKQTRAFEKNLPLTASCGNLFRCVISLDRSPGDQPCQFLNCL